MFEACPKCGMRKPVGGACHYCGTSDKAKKAVRKPAKKTKPRKA